MCKSVYTHCTNCGWHIFARILLECNSHQQGRRCEQSELMPNSYPDVPGCAMCSSNRVAPRERPTYPPIMRPIDYLNPMDDPEQERPPEQYPSFQDQQDHQGTHTSQCHHARPPCQDCPACPEDTPCPACRPPCPSCPPCHACHLLTRHLPHPQQSNSFQSFSADQNRSAIQNVPALQGNIMLPPPGLPYPPAYSYPPTRGPFHDPTQRPYNNPVPRLQTLGPGLSAAFNHRPSARSSQPSSNLPNRPSLPSFARSFPRAVMHPSLPSAPSLPSVSSLPLAPSQPSTGLYARNALEASRPMINQNVWDASQSLNPSTGRTLRDPPSTPATPASSNPQSALHCLATVSAQQPRQRSTSPALRGPSDQQRTSQAASPVLMNPPSQHSRHRSTSPALRGPSTQHSRYQPVSPTLGWQLRLAAHGHTPSDPDPRTVLSGSTPVLDGLPQIAPRGHTTTHSGSRPFSIDYVPPSGWSSRMLPSVGTGVLRPNAAVFEPSLRVTAATPPPPSPLKTVEAELEQEDPEGKDRRLPHT